jgi:hypothetical protein
MMKYIHFAEDVFMHSSAIVFPAGCIIPAEDGTDTGTCRKL